MARGLVWGSVCTVRGSIQTAEEAGLIGQHGTPGLLRYCQSWGPTGPAAIPCGGTCSIPEPAVLQRLHIALCNATDCGWSNHCTSSNPRAVMPVMLLAAGPANFGQIMLLCRPRLLVAGEPCAQRWWTPAPLTADRRSHTWLHAAASVTELPSPGPRRGVPDQVVSKHPWRRHVLRHCEQAC